MYIKVKVQAGSKKEDIKKKSNDSYIISVCEKAERNLANRRICEIAASLYGIPVKSVHIISGHRNPSKILSINLPENLI